MNASKTDAAKFAAVDDGGEVSVSTDAGVTWRPRRALISGAIPYTAIWVGGRLVAGTDNGLYYFSTNWRECGVLPAESTGSYAFHATRLQTTGDGRLLVGTGEEAMFVSSDRCGSFSLADSHLHADYSGSGGVKDVRDAVTGLIWIDDYVFTSGWDGVHRSVDGGATFEEPRLIPSDYIRALDFAPAFPDDPRIFIGGYGGGVWWTEDGGLSYDGSAVGLLGQRVYTQDMEPAPDLDSSGVFFLSADRAAYRSTDDGATWKSARLDFSELTSIHTVDARVYFFGRTESGVSDTLVLYTDDSGGHYTEWTELITASINGNPRDVVAGNLQGDDVMLVPTKAGSGLLASWDGGSTFTTLWSGGVEGEAAVLLWPPDLATRIVLFDTIQGVLISDDGGITFTPSALPPVGTMQAYLGTDDGTLVYVDRGGRIQVSYDGGDVWDETGATLDPAVFVMTSSPRFESTGILLFGTYAGVYYSLDLGATVEPIERFERMETNTYHVACTPVSGSGECATYSDNSVGQGGGLLLATGDRVEFTFQGDEFTVLGPQSGDGSLHVIVDKRYYTTVTATGSDLRVSGLSLGWHDIQLVGKTAPTSSGVRVDAIETLGHGTPIPF